MYVFTDRMCSSLCSQSSHSLHFRSCQFPILFGGGVGSHLNCSFPDFSKQAGFVADWSADFGSVSVNGDAASGAEVQTAPMDPSEGSEGAEGEAQDLPHADAWQTIEDRASSPQDREAATAADAEVRNWESQPNPILHLCEDDEAEKAGSEDDVAGQEGRRKSTPGLIFTNEYGEQVEDCIDAKHNKWARSSEGSVSEYETAEEWGDGGQGAGWMSADEELSENKATEPDGLREVKQVSTQCDKQDRNEFDLCSETQGVAAFNSDPFAETQLGCVFDRDPFAEDQFRDVGGVFEGVVLVPGNGWDADPFANSFAAVGSASSTMSWQEVNDSSGFETSVVQQNSASGTTAEGIKDVKVSRIHKDPENSDMSEDEAANRRFGNLYQQLDTEKEEVLNLFPFTV